MSLFGSVFSRASYVITGTILLVNAAVNIAEIFLRTESVAWTVIHLVLAVFSVVGGIIGFIRVASISNSGRA